MCVCVYVCVCHCVGHCVYVCVFVHVQYFKKLSNTYRANVVLSTNVIHRKVYTKWQILFNQLSDNSLLYELKFNQVLMFIANYERSIR